ncbi:glucosaminidase domain-containing protein [Cohnella sp. LGH]|uniref:glucosaminidase domain-containing protein n=1 Tax=Cohnella sp. LGH TaxID=1619153 RepID=UPI001ADCEB73|nr:glucosaminidase domain-containing protein [Cohnella sp. LGH]QTH43096.1 glucosaminidase domain-containing protein [Cohnella sp. LGH]
METLDAVFRKHSELEPTGKLSMLGESVCSADRLLAYARRRNPQSPDVSESYVRLGKLYGIRGDVAYCQAAYDTRWWTSELAGPEWAPQVRAQWADEEAIEIRMQMLYALATFRPFPSEAKVADDRQIAHIERSGWRGKAACWEDLSGKWSHSGNVGYGRYVVAMWRGVLEWDGQGVPPKLPVYRQEFTPSVRTAVRKTGTVDWSSFVSEQMKWLLHRQLLPVPAPHPDRKVTWEELAALLRQWENSRRTQEQKERREEDTPDVP